jgi:hypothetical protein
VASEVDSTVNFNWGTGKKSREQRGGEMKQGRRGIGGEREEKGRKGGKIKK